MNAQVAGLEYAGCHCKRCDVEIEPADVVDVDVDGEYDDEGCARGRVNVKHVECPPDEA